MVFCWIFLIKDKHSPLLCKTAKKEWKKEQIKMNFYDNKHYATNDVNWVELVLNPEYAFKVCKKSGGAGLSKYHMIFRIDLILIQGSAIAPGPAREGAMLQTESKPHVKYWKKKTNKKKIVKKSSILRNQEHSNTSSRAWAPTNVSMLVKFCFHIKCRFSLSCELDDMAI